MTDRLYYHDSYVHEFDANVLETIIHEGKTAVVLDRTAFYPSSGGQPFDVGTLSGANVFDVVDTEDGRILHVVDRVPDGLRVSGRIDWARRFDHMQQHTGQHVLSAAFDRLLSAKTESFHLGADGSTIDLARELSPAEIARGEDEANRVVWEDRPVTIRFAGPDEIAMLPLRKEPRREGTLRLIDVQDFDLSACGGTHVARTGAIGVIAGGDRRRAIDRLAARRGGPVEAARRAARRKRRRPSGAGAGRRYHVGGARRATVRPGTSHARSRKSKAHVMSDAPLLMVVDDDPSVLLLVDVLAEKMGFRGKAVP